MGNAIPTIYAAGKAGVTSLVAKHLGHLGSSVVEQAGNLLGKMLNTFSSPAKVPAPVSSTINTIVQIGQTNTATVNKMMSHQDSTKKDIRHELDRLDEQLNYYR